jgi:multiple sugar transport system substrate-binding protein
VGRLTRRRLLTGAAATLGAVGTRPARAAGATLRICQWTHLVPEFDDWFDRKFAREWGQRNGAQVVVEHVAASDLRSRATMDVAARRGHDLFAFLDPPASFLPYVLPLDDVVAECEQRFGKPGPPVVRATYDPRTRHHFALCESWVPAPLHYRADWWEEAGVRPDTWEHIRDGARKIKVRHGVPAGFGLAPEADSNAALRGLLWAHGAQEQDEAGQVRINSRETVEAVRLMTAIFRDAMTTDVFTWDPSSNNRLYVSGRCSIVQNAVSALRTAERQNPAVARKTTLVSAAAGPRARLGCPQLVHCYVVWKFAEQRELAKRFLVDLVAAGSDAFRASEFYNLPAFPRVVPDLRGRLGAEKPYQLLADAGQWSALPGHPGPVSGAIDEAVHRFVVPRMFARAARGEQAPEAAVRQAEAELKQLFARWAERTPG